MTKYGAGSNRSTGQKKCKHEWKQIVEPYIVGMCGGGGGGNYRFYCTKCLEITNK